MDLLEQVRSFIIETFYVANPAELADEDSLLEKGIVDSTGVLEVVGFIENDLGIEVDDDDLVPDNLDSIANIHRFVERKRAAR
ncbi:MAG: acyl carrier protein [Actinomycetota bacterium]